MAVYTLKEARERLQKALDALDRAIERKSYSLGGKSGYSIEAPNVNELQELVKKWEKEVKRLEKLQKSKRVLQIGSAIKR